MTDQPVSEGVPDGMVPMYGVQLGGDGPGLLADLNTIALDLRYAERLLQRVAALPGDDESSSDDRRAFYDAAAIAYRRGFMTGRSLLQRGKSRAKVPDDVVDGLDAMQREAHDALLDRANTHVAHRVSDAEQGRVFLMLNNPDIERSVAGVAFLHVRFVGPDDEHATAAASASGQLAGSIEQTASETQQRMIAEAQALDVDALYARAHPMG